MSDSSFTPAPNPSHEQNLIFTTQEMSELTSTVETLYKYYGWDLLIRAMIHVAKEEMLYGNFRHLEDVKEVFTRLISGLNVALSSYRGENK